MFFYSLIYSTLQYIDNFIEFFSNSNRDRLIYMCVQHLHFLHCQAILSLATKMLFNYTSGLFLTNHLVRILDKSAIHKLSLTNLETHKGA